MDVLDRLVLGDEPRARPSPHIIGDERSRGQAERDDRLFIDADPSGVPRPAAERAPQRPGGAHPSAASPAGAGESVRGRVLGQEAGGEPAGQAADVSGEIEEAEIAPALDDLVVRPGRRGMLCEAEAGAGVAFGGDLDAGEPHFSLKLQRTASASVPRLTLVQARTQAFLPTSRERNGTPSWARS